MFILTCIPNSNIRHAEHDRIFTSIIRLWTVGEHGFSLSRLRNFQVIDISFHKYINYPTIQT